MVSGEQIFLRALEPEDLDFLYQAENDSTIWQAGLLQQPISKFTLKAYLENIHLTLDEIGQLRMLICLKQNNQAIGMVDLFDHDPTNQRAAVGIMLLQEQRGKGLGVDAISLLKRYTRNNLKLHQLYCHVQEDNLPSIGLFAKCGFTNVGILKDWIRTADGFRNVYIMQCLL
jgi:diamine N-acetyltransferase